MVAPSLVPHEAGSQAQARAAAAVAFRYDRRVQPIRCLRGKPIMGALDLSPEEFQSLAARVTDLATRFLTALPTLPSYPSVSGQQTHERFGEPLPQIGL